MKMEQRHGMDIVSRNARAQSRPREMPLHRTSPPRASVKTALILCLVLLACYPPVATARQRVMGSQGAIAAAGANFVIADFDGDSLPDFATVQPGLAMASRTNYWIHFNFSLGSRWSFEVSAPAGGLQIASRDVNGDSFLDLIISTRIANEPVAVLLNDGRGNFHLADREAFGAGIWQARAEWQAGATRWDDDESAIASAGWAAFICGAAACGNLSPAMGKTSIVAEKTDYFVLPHEDRGRAPPAA
jgi:hypothetical protein